MKIKIDTVIVDDDPTARELLYKQISNHFPHINVVGEAANGADAYKLIDKLNPDLVFLDMHMPGGSGIELIDRFKKPEFYTVFYSTFSDYALDAIKRDAFDYLLKPLDPADLSLCLNKLTEKMTSDSERNSLEYNQKVEVYIKGEFHFIPQKEILFVKASGSYSVIHLANGDKLVLSKNLKAVEQLLDQDNFVRAHNSFVINVRKIQTCNFQKHFCTLIDGTIIKTAVRRKEEIRSKLQRIWTYHH
ncbi:MAG: two-component system LytT family response regulator [Flavobacteriales bacterium]|jgi:two-component system LytT family response regulator